LLVVLLCCCYNFAAQHTDCSALLLAAAGTATTAAVQQVELLGWPRKSLQSLLHCILAHSPGFRGFVCCCCTATKHGKAPTGHCHCAQLRPSALVQLFSKLLGGIGDTPEALVSAGTVEGKAAWQWCILHLQLHLAQHAWLQLAQPGNGPPEESLSKMWILPIAVQGLRHLQNYQLPHCQPLQLKAPLALPFIILRDGWKPKTAQVESMAAAVTHHHGFWTVLAAICQAGCVRVNGIPRTL
jgi:hypothetical protein